MKTSNPMLDSIIESQTQFMSNWLDSARKFQSAFSGGNIGGEGQALYKEFLDKQMNVLGKMQQNSAATFENGNENNPVEFFKNWFSRQSDYARQMADFNLNLQNNFAGSGKTAQDFFSAFGQNNTAFTGIYNSWLNAVNNTYEALTKNMDPGFTKNMFGKFMEGNQMYAKMQEFFQPMSDAIRNGQFNFEAFKNYFTPESYNTFARQMFGGLYNEASLREMYDDAMSKLHQYFTGQNNLSKEYFEQIRNMGKDFSGILENSGPSMKELYSRMNNIFGKTFEPLMKIVAPGKEKESAEAIISLLDRMAQYSIHQAELQSYLQATLKRSVEKTALQFSEKYSDPKSLADFKGAQELYTEWVKNSEGLFTELFASEEFSKVKGEALNLSMEVRKQFEGRFEEAFSNTPFVFKSEMEDLHKSIYQLKKQIKDLQAELGKVELAEQDNSGKSRKK